MLRSSFIAIGHWKFPEMLYFLRKHLNKYWYLRIQGRVFLLFSPESDDRLSLNFHRFVISNKSLGGTAGLCEKRSPLTKVTPVRFPLGAICELSCVLVLCCATRVFQTIYPVFLPQEKIKHFRSWLCSVVIMGWCGWQLNAPLHACFSNT